MSKIICRLPGRKFYVGDPCYLFQNHAWDQFLRFTNNLTERTFSLNGFWCFLGPTGQQVGQYIGSDKFVYPVDSGHLCVIPMEVLKEENLKELLGDEKFNLKDILDNKLGDLEEFEDKVKVVWDDYLFTIGTLTIDTKTSLEKPIAGELK